MECLKDDRKKLGEPKYIEELQWMRGLMTLLVLLGHVNLAIDSSLFHGVFVQGYCGVDWFFVLSGFLLRYTYRSSENVFNFCKKRFIRIYPVYWLYTLIALCLAIASKAILHRDLVYWISLDFSGIVRSLLLFPTNIGINELPILAPAWTLPYEIFFYIFFMLYVGGKKKIFKGVAAVWIIAIIVVNALVKPESYLIDFILSPLFLEFFFGLFVAEILIGGGKSIR